jgi:hypothetical protein
LNQPNVKSTASVVKARERMATMLAQCSDVCEQMAIEIEYDE